VATERDQGQPTADSRRLIRGATSHAVLLPTPTQPSLGYDPNVHRAQNAGGAAEEGWQGALRE
jgi:hypothetical protein